MAGPSTVISILLIINPRFAPFRRGPLVSSTQMNYLCRREDNQMSIKADVPRINMVVVNGRDHRIRPR